MDATIFGLMATDISTYDGVPKGPVGRTGWWRSLWTPTPTATMTRPVMGVPGIKESVG